MKIALIMIAAVVFTACSTAGGENTARSGSTSNGNTANTTTAKSSGKGVDPTKACSIFEKAGFKPGAYEWDDKYNLSSCSSSKYVGPSGRQRPLRFFASGDRSLVDHLEFSVEMVLDDTELDMMKSSKKVESELRSALLDALAAGGDDMANLTSGKPMPIEAKDAIKAMKSGKWQVGDVSIEVEVDDKAGLGSDVNLHFRY